MGYKFEDRFAAAKPLHAFFAMEHLNVGKRVRLAGRLSLKEFIVFWNKASQVQEELKVMCLTTEIIMKLHIKLRFLIRAAAIKSSGLLYCAVCGPRICESQPLTKEVELKYTAPQLHEKPECSQHMLP